MTDRQIKDFKRKFIKSAKMKLQCIGAVISRSILPFGDSENSFVKSKSKIASYVIFAFSALLLGISQPKGSVSPFAISLLCAIFGQNTIPVYIGACISCLFYGTTGLILFISYSLIFLLRRSITASEYNEKAGSKIIYSLFFSLFSGVVIIFRHGFCFNSFLEVIYYTSIAVLCTKLFSNIFGEKSTKSAGLQIFSLYTFFICLIPAFNRLSFPGVDLGLLFSCISALYFAKHKGAVFGCVAGFLFGFSCTYPLLSAPLGMSCLCAGYLFSKNPVSAIFSFTISFSLTYIYLFGASSYLTLLPIILAASLIFAAIYTSLPDIFLKVKSEKGIHSKAPIKNDEFQKVSDSLSGLSSLIYKFAEHMKAPSNAETGMIFDEVLNDVCSGCSMSGMCYAKREGNISAIKKDVVSTLHASVLSKEHLSKLLLDKCIRASEITDSINSKYSDLRFIAMKSNRTQTVASIYSSMSRLIKSTGGTQYDNNERDSRLELVLKAALEKIGVEFSEIIAKGKRSKEIFIYGIKAETIPCSAKDLSVYLSGECKILLSEPVFDISENANMIMKLYRDEKIKLEYAQCCEPKHKGSVSGDTLQFFETEAGLFYTILADGMGSGKTAAATSRLSCVFLEKLLKGGAARNVCIEMLNSLLLSKNDETFAGLDILEIDKICGTAHFVKAGAAPSFVLRKSNLYKISSETPPVGIIPAFSAESTRFALENGDIIIMVSDGVISGEDDGIWLSELIHLDTECEPAYLASQLIERAKMLCDRKDDMSACVVKVEL